MDLHFNTDGRLVTHLPVLHTSLIDALLTDISKLYYSLLV